jgi:hypothetical protein
MFASGVELPQSRQESNAGAPLVHLRQLSLIQRVRLSSLTSPAAKERMMEVACAGSGAKATPFLWRNTIMAMKAMRLFPSTKA